MAEAGVVVCRRTVPPERTILVLSSDVPDDEGEVLVLDGLNIESFIGQIIHLGKHKGLM